MDLSHPLTSLLGDNVSRVLSRLATVSDGLSGRQIAGVAGVPSASASRALADLVGVGLVHTRDVGRSRLYRLNREHVLWKPLEAMMASSAIIEHRIAETVGDGATVATFGSFARNEAGALSDIDLLIVWDNEIVAEERIAALQQLHERIPTLTGNRLDIVDITEEDLARMIQLNDPLVESWAQDARSVSVSDLNALIERLRKG
jgi:predicted nucleotidyltransferase